MAAPPISIKLRCASWKQLASIYERDLARSAIFLKSAAPPPVGTRVRINLTLPTQTLIVLNGSVDRHVGAGELNGRGPGVDIKLHNVPQSALWLIESALESARRKGAMSSPAGQDLNAASEERADMDLAAGEHLVEAESDLIAALSQELASLRKLNPFQVLGVGYETTDDEVRAAFGSLTKRYHPDRFARYESGEARRIAAEIFILIRNAYQSLDTAEKRSRAQDELLRRRAARTAARAAGAPSTPPPAASSAPPPAASSAPEQAAPPDTRSQPGPASPVTPDTPPAKDELAQAYALLDQGNLEAALKQFRLLSHRNPGDRTARVGLDLAEGLKALNDKDRLEAAQRFEAVLELEPNNERAARELAEMRRQATNERKGLLTRLLNQKE